MEPKELAAIPAGGILEMLHQPGFASGADAPVTVTVPTQLTLM
jgi:hypothetical protein